MKTLSPEILLFASLGIALIPLMIAVGTCYLKFSIVLSLLRSGFGTQQAPSTSLVIGISLVMSCLVMEPIIARTIQTLAVFSVPELSSLNIQQLAQKGGDVVEPWRQFLVSHSGDRELTLLTHLASRSTARSTQRDEGPEVIDRSQVSLTAAIAAFVLSEIKTGFTLSFFLLLPFFVIDLVVANLLVALGLTMMSPVVVSLPIKILLFLSTDGWLLLVRTLVEAYR